MRIEINASVGEGSLAISKNALTIAFIKEGVTKTKIIGFKDFGKMIEAGHKEISEGDLGVVELPLEDKWVAFKMRAHTDLVVSLKIFPSPQNELIFSMEKIEETLFRLE